MSITSRINEMSSHIEQAYDELQGLGADLTNVNKNIENISMVLDDIYDSMPQVSGEGTTLTLEDTRVGKIKSTLKGNTSQTTYSGKNLLGLSNGTNTSGGLTVTRNNGLITFTGTASSTYPNTGNVPYTLGTGTYTISSTNNTYDFYLWFRNSSNETIYTANLAKATKTITITTNDVTSVVIGVEHLTTGTSYNLSTSIQIESGNSATSYEPYVGGTTSPNPSYPQPVNVVSGDNTINVEGKNLLDEKGLLNSTFITGVYKYTKVNFKGNRELYFKAQLKSGKTALSGLYVALANYGSNPNAGTSAFSIRDGAVQNSGISNDFTGMEDLYISFYPTSYTWEEISNTYDFWVSTSDINYSEYQGQKEYQVNLGVENLFDKDNVNYLNDVFIGGTGTITSGSGNTSIYIKCNANTTYTIKKEVDNVFRVGTTQNVPIVGATTNDYKDNASGSEITLTTSSNANYLVVFLRNASSSKTLETIINSLQITTGNHIQQISNNPIELCKIGNYEDKFIRTSGKNLFDKDSISNGFLDESGIVGGDTSAYRTSDFIPILPNTAYYKTTTSSPRTKYYDKNKQPLNTTTYWDIPIGGNAGTFTTPSNAYYFRFSYPVTGVNVNSIMINKGTTALPYEPYGVGKWYLHKEIRKVVLNGSESGWSQYANANNLVYFGISLLPNKANGNNILANYFSKTTNIWGKTSYENGIQISGNNQDCLFITTDHLTIASFKTWLSANNVVVYYVLETPVNTALEDM